MFTYECFIKKNTESIRQKLLDIGLKNDFNPMFREHGEKYNAIMAFNGKFQEVNISYIKECPPIRLENFIDCRTNKNLFLAVASLRDDSNINQWFVGVGGEWILKDPKCTEVSCDIIVSEPDRTYLYWHKATLEELKKHFACNTKNIIKLRDIKHI